jgi:alpha-L-rhamnosidase
MLRFLLQTFPLFLGATAGLSGAESGAPSSQPFVDRLERFDDPSVADWIAPPTSVRAETGLYLFRRRLEFRSAPAVYRVHLSADPRYKLYVNGAFVTLGPAAGDPLEWSYATLDLAPWLRAGENVIALEVCDPGPFSPPRQVALQTALVVQAEAGDAVEGVPPRTDGSWRVWRSAGWSPLPMDAGIAGGGYIAGATERFDAARHPWGWREPGFDDTGWPTAEVIGKASHGGLDTWQGTVWTLRPRTIPLLDVDDAPIGQLRAGEVSGEPLSAGMAWPIAIPPHEKARLLFDRGELEMGFPRLRVSGGAGASVQLRYQEALFRPDGTKGHRDEIEGKVMKGVFDRFLPDGASGRTFEPAWLRVYRYLEVTVETGDEGLVLEELSLRRVRYPFERQGGFRSTEPTHEAILEASWHTLDLCALETYMDCPYYEQIQYIGDTRIQGLISLYMTGDDRLLRRALAQFDRSRLPMGLTRSAYPVRGSTPQIIPPFTLLYISMVHDYHRHRDDPEWVGGLLPGIRFSLEWFLARLDARGLLGPLPYWNHTDGGAAGFLHGSPPGAASGGSIQLTLLLVAALDDAAALSEAHGRAEEAGWYREEAENARVAVRKHGYDAARGLFAETPAREVFSQHTNAYAILTNTVPEAGRAALAEKLVSDPSLIQGTLYFQFYIFEALAAAGRGELILPQLERWREMLALGLTTFPEHGPESRSDAHAWAAHPLFHLLATTGGVRSAAPGFARVRIAPAPGALEGFTATVCHPRGLVKVAWSQASAAPVEGVFTVELPGDLEGDFVWAGRTIGLRPGTQRIEWRNGTLTSAHLP